MWAEFCMIYSPQAESVKEELTDCIKFINDMYEYLTEEQVNDLQLIVERKSDKIRRIIMHGNDNKIGDTCCKVNEFRIRDESDTQWILTTKANRDVVLNSIRFLREVKNDRVSVEDVKELLKSYGFDSQYCIVFEPSPDFEL